MSSLPAVVEVVAVVAVFAIAAAAATGAGQGAVLVPFIAWCLLCDQFWGAGQGAVVVAGLSAVGRSGNCWLLRVLVRFQVLGQVPGAWSGGGACGCWSGSCLVCSR